MIFNNILLEQTRASIGRPMTKSIVTLYIANFVKLKKSLTAN